MDTANTDDSTVSMFTVNQTTGVLTPTAPAYSVKDVHARPTFIDAKLPDCKSDRQVSLCNRIP